MEQKIANRNFKGISSATLHILAMAFMLLDHMWATIIIGNEWMTCVGRLAYPMFAFMIVEGFHYTRNLKKYMLRLLMFALISEIPFDYMYGGMWFYPFHQNVMWTFLIALMGLWLIEKSKQKSKENNKQWIRIVVPLIVVPVWTLLGYATMIDYYGTGILLIFVFYFFRGRKWWCYIGQFIGMYIINVNMLGGYYYPITIWGHEFELMQQGIAMLSLIPIWLYRGRQGYHASWFKYFCYAFYPLHISILAIIALAG